MDCRTAQCWHPCPAGRPSGCPPPPARCQCGSTGHWPRTCWCRWEQDLVKEKEGGSCGKTLSLGNLVILRTILKYSTVLHIERQVHTLVILVSHYLAPPIVKTNSEAGAVGLHVAFGAVVPVNASNTDGASDVHQAVELHFHLSTIMLIAYVLEQISENRAL